MNSHSEMRIADRAAVLLHARCPLTLALSPEGARENITTPADSTRFSLRFNQTSASPRQPGLWSLTTPAGRSLSSGERVGARAGHSSEALTSALPHFPTFPLSRLLTCLFLALTFASTRAADTSPADELASLRILDGFEVSLFASEADGVRKPIQIRFDPDGRLWVAGSVVYPQLKPGEKPHDQILILEDTDGDGRADKTTVFADDLLMPTGLELGDGGLYVNSGTELLHLRDTNGDGKADERRVVFRGFGTGDTHQTINSFSWGPSGELMFSQGLHIHSRIETPTGIEELRQAGVWRYWPHRNRLDPFWSGAMGAHNPFGNIFDHWGQPFVVAGNGHGVYHLTQAMIRTDHFLEQRSLWSQGRKFGGGDFVENSRWPAAHQGELITGGYLQNTVERFGIADEGGSSFKVTHLPPLIESTNLAFRIVDARFGPDGSLFLADWFNPVIGHYQASFRDPNRDKEHGRIWRVVPKASTPIGNTKSGPNFTKRTTTELVAELKSPERWNRQMAKRVLAERPTKEVTNALQQWLTAQAPSSVEADHALFEALGVFASHEVFPAPLVQKLARSKTPEARAYATRLIGQFAGSNLDGSTLGLLGALAADPHPRVRLEAIVACSYLPKPNAVELAAIATDQPMDAALEYAFTQCVHALKPRWQDAQARGELKFGFKASRQTAFARASGGTDAAAFAARRLRRVAEVALDRETLEQLADVIVNSGAGLELLTVLPQRTFTVGTNYQADLHGATLAQLVRVARNRESPASNEADGYLRPLLDSPEPAVRGGALQLTGLWRVAPFRGRVIAAATNTAAPPAVRQAAFMGTAGFGDDEARRFLTLASSAGFWGATPDHAQRQADAAAALVQLDLTAAAKAAATLFADPLDNSAVRSLVTALIEKRGGPAALRTALTTTPPSAANAQAILAVLSGSGRREPELAAVLAKAAGAGAAAPATLADIPTLAAAVRASGNAKRGAEIFQRPALACSTCHAVDGTSGKIGPNLSSLGTAQTVDFILGAILDPQKEVKEGFMAHEITAKDGEVYQGYLRGETADEVSLFNHLTGEVVKLRSNQIAERRQLGTLMPPGLADGLSREELRDLVAYLAALGKR